MRNEMRGWTEWRPWVQGQEEDPWPLAHRWVEIGRRNEDGEVRRLAVIDPKRLLAEVSGPGIWWRPPCAAEWETKL
jgi:hypothetical protein